VEVVEVTMISERAQRLCLLPLLESGAAVRRAVGAALDGLGASPEEVADMVLATSEAFNNSICHGGMRSEDQLWMEIEAVDTELIVTFDYKGSPFPLVSPTLPDPSQAHGRGRYLMEQLTDRVSYVFADHCTQVELRKRIRGRSGVQAFRRSGVQGQQDQGSS
jgi:anti-sigma regulatory factor (Ser/Thr protein kinase)